MTDEILKLTKQGMSVEEAKQTLKTGIYPPPRQAGQENPQQTGNEGEKKK